MVLSTSALVTDGAVGAAKAAVSYGPVCSTVAHQGEEEERRPSQTRREEGSHAHRK